MGGMPTETATHSARGDAPPSRRWALWIGVTLVAVGLGLLAYVAWQYWGSNWVSHRKHDQIVADTEELWAEQDEVFMPEGEVGALIRIPEFGEDYVVPVLEGTSDEVLAAGYGHFEDTAGPGEKGNYALAAHRVTHGEPLRDMPELEPGDEVIVETRTATHTYVLTSGGDDLVVPFTEIWVIDPLPDNPDEGEPEPTQEPGQRLITLTTCSEIFHTDNRMIAFGLLKESTPK
jgi:sortase A